MSSVTIETVTVDRPTDFAKFWSKVLKTSESLP